MVEITTEKQSLIRAGLPAVLYGAAFATLFFAIGTVYNTVVGSPSAVVFTAVGFLFGATVKLSDSL